MNRSAAPDSFGEHASRGVALGVGSAFFAALYLVPFKAAALTASRAGVVLAMLVLSALFNSVWALGPRPAPALNRVAWISAAALALFTVLGNVAIIESLAHVEPAVTSAVMQTQVLMVAVMARVFLSERITRALALGGLLAVGGFISMQSQQLGGDALGAYWALVAALSFAAMLIITRYVATDIAPVTVNALRLWMSAGLLALLPGSLTELVQLDGTVWLLAATAAFAGPTVSRLLLMFAVRDISASHTKLTTLITPLFALGLGWIAFAQVPTLRELLGGSVILVGVALPLVELVRGASVQG